MGSIAVDAQTRDEKPLSSSDRTTFKLPDGETEVWIATTVDDTVTEYVVGSGVAKLARWKTDGTQTRLSPAMVNDDGAHFTEVLRLQLLGLDEVTLARHSGRTESNRT